MKIILKLLILTIMLVFNSSAIANETKISYDKNTQTLVEKNYNRFETSVWNKYFVKQSKKVKKVWKSNKELFKASKYKTSYARIMFLVDKKGEIVSYEIKSSCVPYKDKEFIEQVKNTVNSIKKFDVLPSEYGFDYIVFTIKLHTNLPNNINESNIDWNRLGIANIEVDKRNRFVIVK